MSIYLALTRNKRYTDETSFFKEANGRLTLNTRIIKRAALNGMLSGIMLLPALFFNNAAASGLYDLKVPTLNTTSLHGTDSYRLNFRYREETGVIQRVYTKDEILGVKNFSGAELRSKSNLEQYDATIYYALGNSLHGLFSKHQWLSIDLGVNFKFIEQTYESTKQQQNGFRTHYGAYPMFSAAALFDLPLSGMTASVEGSYFNYKTRELSEYRAKLTYQIDNIFGVSGGWEQQQYQLDASDSLKFGKEGPFVDLFYRF